MGRPGHHIEPGQVFKRLTALHPIEGDPKCRWTCRCACGKETRVAAAKLVSGLSKSCGCWRRDNGRRNRTHGDASTNGVRAAEYRIWAEVKTRCYNAKRPMYKHYGGRGIAMCDRWRNSYEAFFEDMGRRPSDKHSIDRIDNDGNYEPGNCRWVLVAVQAANKRNNRHITIDSETKHLAEWCRHFGISTRTFHNRVFAGASEQEALSKPTWKTKRKAALKAVSGVESG